MVIQMCSSPCLLKSEVLPFCMLLLCTIWGTLVTDMKNW